MTPVPYASQKKYAIHMGAVFHTKGSVLSYKSVTQISQRKAKITNRRCMFHALLQVSRAPLTAMVESVRCTCAAKARFIAMRVVALSLQGDTETAFFPDALSDSIAGSCGATSSANHWNRLLQTYLSPLVNPFLQISRAQGKRRGQVWDGSTSKGKTCYACLASVSSFQNSMS